MKKKQLTIVDLAKLLGISKSTVSRALQGNSQINPATREKVLDLVRAAGYQPNLMAMGLKRQRSNIIGIIVPDIERPYYAALTSSVQQFALNHNFHTVISQSKDLYNSEKDILHTLLGLQVDGILMVHSKETVEFPHVSETIRKGIPIILVDRSCDAFDIHQVENDHFGGGFAIGQHLAQTGSKNIVIIGGPAHLKLSNLRIEGCREGAANAGVHVRPENIYYGDFSREKTLTLLDNILCSKNRPDSIFCVYDRGALEILKQLEFRQIAVPDEIAVAGFGNETMSKYVRPSLTTVDQAPRRIGERATETLIREILSDEPLPVQRHLIKSELIIRDSTRKEIGNIPRNVHSSYPMSEKALFRVNTITGMFRDKFEKLPVLTVRAPGSITVFGDHTDYHNGVGLSASVDREIFFCLSESTDDQCYCYSANYDELVSFSPDHPEQAVPEWCRLIISVITTYRGANFQVKPFTLAFGGNIPMHTGLSSSTALQCGVFFALNALFDLGLTKSELIRLAHTAEADLHGTKMGIMDKYACMLGKRGGFIKLDGQSMEFEYIPFPYDKYAIILCDSGVQYGTGRAEFSNHIKDCREALESIREKFPDVTSLRDVRMDMLDAAKGLMRPAVFKRSNYIVKATELAESAACCLEKRQLVRFGSLLYATHTGLKEEYGISCPELNFLVESAAQMKDTIGSKMIGKGFGGSIVSIVKKAAVDNFMEQMAAAYKKKFGIDPALCSLNMSNGVSIIA